MQKTFKIVIDPGHGGKDPGAVGRGLQEKDIVLTLALRIGKLLAARGAEVIYTRQTDTFIDLEDRPLEAKRQGADYFLSLHVNAGGGTGFESFVQTGAHAAAVAYQNVIHQRVALLYKQEGFRDRGTKQADLAVLRGCERAGIPATLLEYGFIDHPKDAAMLADPTWLERLAIATAAGVAAAFGLPEAPEEAPSFSDTSGHWAAKVIGVVSAAEIMQGYGDGTFRADQPVTRAELAKVVNDFLYLIEQKTKNKVDGFR